MDDDSESVALDDHEPFPDPSVNARHFYKQRYPLERLVGKDPEEKEEKKEEEDDRRRPHMACRVTARPRSDTMLPALGDRNTPTLDGLPRCAQSVQDLGTVSAVAGVWRCG